MLWYRLTIAFTALATREPTLVAAVAGPTKLALSIRLSTVTLPRSFKSKNKIHNLKIRKHDKAHAVGWCAAWALAVRGADHSFTKEQHKTYEPPEATVTSLLPKIHEVEG